MRAAALADGFRLTAFFLNRHVCEPRGLELANARDGFVQAALKALPADASVADGIRQALKSLSKA